MAIALAVELAYEPALFNRINFNLDFFTNKKMFKNFSMLCAQYAALAISCQERISDYSDALPCYISCMSSLDLE